MITKNLAKKIHTLIINSSGGMDGIREESLLLSALKRPLQSFGGQELYPTVFDKAAALFQSLLMNHPFYDGNKRTAYLIVRLYLEISGYNFSASQEERYDFIISIITKQMEVEEISQWLRTNTNKTDV